MPADAVHHQINDLLRLGEALVAEDVWEAVAERLSP